MRKLLISLMAASMLVPAAAQAADDDRRGRSERSNRSDDKSDNRSSRSQSSHRAERSNDSRPARAERAHRAERSNDNDRAVQRVRRQDRDVQRVERVRRADRDVQVQTQPVQRTQETERRYGGLTGALTRVARDGNDGRIGDRDGRDWRRDRDGDRDGRDWRRDRDGDRDGRWRRDRDGDRRWDRDWRRDHRYSWSNYRNRYRSIFRLGRYFDPYGYGYRRFSIGFSLWPSYYGSSFWLNDPWQYRLPPAYGPYRWVRYYNDALLVNIHTGQVVDVEHNVFW
mgnify:CR=1 FL=1